MSRKKQKTELELIINDLKVAELRIRIEYPTAVLARAQAREELIDVHKRLGAYIRQL